MKNPERFFCGWRNGIALTILSQNTLVAERSVEGWALTFLMAALTKSLLTPSCEHCTLQNFACNEDRKVLIHSKGLQSFPLTVG